jgi:hypothetical protein
MTHRLFIIAALVVSGAGPIAGAADRDPALDPALPYHAERSNPVTYDVDFSVVVTAPYDTRVLKVWLPMPPSDAGQQVTYPFEDWNSLGVQP